MTSDALQQIGHGLNNLNAALLANQAASERRHHALEQRLDERFDALYKRLDEVCDKGGQDHKEFRDAIVNLDTRLRVQEARQQGRADVLKPVIEWAGKNWAGVLLVGYIAWTQLAQPILHSVARDPAQAVAISGSL